MAADTKPSALDAQLCVVDADGRLHLLVRDRDGNDVADFDLETLLAGKLPGFDHRPWALANHAGTLVALRRMTRAAENRLHQVWDSKDWHENIDFESDADRAHINYAQSVLAGEGKA